MVLLRELDFKIIITRVLDSTTSGHIKWIASHATNSCLGGYPLLLAWEAHYYIYGADQKYRPLFQATPIAQVGTGQG